MNSFEIILRLKSSQRLSGLSALKAENDKETLDEEKKDEDASQGDQEKSKPVKKTRARRYRKPSDAAKKRQDAVFIDPQRKIYIFEVDKRANCLQIRKALEEIFHIKKDIYAVRTSILPAKRKIYRGRVRVIRPETKKVYLVMKRGKDIDFIERQNLPKS
jgi:ribosomal protein L23